MMCCTGNGQKLSRFTFNQFSNAFVPYLELDELQQLELLKSRKWELLEELERCHKLARCLMDLPPPGFDSLSNTKFAFGLSRWLFEAKCHQLPKLTDLPPSEQQLPATMVYRTHINDLISHAKRCACYG